ncbi:MAG: hypothetical protein ACI30K_03450 [Muribaculaceae bacterium]
MKHYFSNLCRGIALAALAVVTAAPTATAGYSNIYIVGDAVPECGWDRGKAQSLTNTGAGTFVFEGMLGKGQFKFTPNCYPYQSGSYHEDYNSTGYSTSFVAKTENESINDGYGDAHGVDYYDYSTGSDYKFYNNTPGYYRLVLSIPDGNAWSLRVYQPMLYIIGGAAPGGWSLDKAIAVFADGGGSLSKATWSGTLRRGDLKFVTTSADFTPCYCASSADEALTAGSHRLVYNSGSNGVEDHKFKVTRDGLYTLSLDISDAANASMTVASAAEPALAGGYVLGEGNYVVGVKTAAADGARHLYTAPVPRTLYVYNYFDANDHRQMSRTADGVFTAIAELKQGSWYKFVYDLDAPAATAFAPVGGDVTLGSEPTRNIMPLDGNSYIVDADGWYKITVDFYDRGSEWGGVRYAVSPVVTAVPAAGIDDAAGEAITITAADRVITVCGADAATPIVVCNLAGAVVGTTATTAVAPGVYIVAAGSVIKKLVVK